MHIGNSEPKEIDITCSCNCLHLAQTFPWLIFTKVIGMAYDTCMDPLLILRIEKTISLWVRFVDLCQLIGLVFGYTPKCSYLASCEQGSF